MAALRSTHLGEKIQESPEGLRILEVVELFRSQHAISVRSEKASLIALYADRVDEYAVLVVEHLATVLNQLAPSLS